VKRQQIIDYVAPNVLLFPTKCALAFGTQHGLPKFGADILLLFQQGYFQTLIISGGFTTHSKASEASVLCDLLNARGIPKSAILIEEHAANTAENVIFTREKFKHLAVEELLLIGKISSKRRYLMTVRKQWPAIRKVCCHGVNYFSCPADQWWKDREFRTRVIAEYRKIPRYIEKGFISEISIVNGIVS